MITEQLLEGWMNESDAMRTINCKRTTLYYLRKNGKVGYSKIGRKVFYEIASINNLLKLNKTDAR
jgi:hypothetical protein